MILENGKKVFDIEIEELRKTKSKLDKTFIDVVEILKNTTGKVVILGIGKSGIIGKKIAASMSSTGTHCVFVNAAEGLHGDLGVINKDDICILISNSGSSEEVINLLPTLKTLGNTLIALTGNAESKLAKNSDYILDIGIEKEACPLQLAPTSSTTATLVMGDALTIALMQEKNFKPNNFALYHPGGALGRRLLTRVKDKLVPIEELTFIEKENTLLNLITQHKMDHGIAFIYEENKNNIIGILTDGDIRRNIKKHTTNSFDIILSEIMNPNYFKIDDINTQLIDVLPIFEEKKISSCPVIQNGEFKGLVELSDIYSII